MSPASQKVKQCYMEYCAPWRRSLWRSHLLDDGLVGAVVLAQQDATGVLGRVVLVQPVEQRHVQVSLARKLTVDKRAEL